MGYVIPADELAKLDGMNEPMRSQLIRLLTDGGGRVHVMSGVRSNQRQQELWAEALRKYGDPEIADNWVARPGTSNHEHGWAVDLTGDKEWARSVAGQYGMHFPLANEDWHMEWAGEHSPGSAMPAMGPDGQMQGWNGGISYDLNYTDPAAQQNPKDVLANRLHAVLSMIGLNGADGGPGVTVQDPMSMGIQGGMSEAPMDMGGQGAGGNQGSQTNFMTGTLAAGGAEDPNGYGAYARSKFAEYGWSDADYRALVALWNEESGDGQSTYDKVLWNPAADNRESTAFGIAQFLDDTWATVGARRTSDPRGQIDAGLKYIAQRYQNPRNALDFHHRKNWY